MIYRLITALTLSVTSIFGTVLQGGGAPTASSSSIAIQEREQGVHKSNLPDTSTILLLEQLKHKRIGSVKFWEAVAWCETNHNWKDTGYFSGGLGMAQSVWVGYGGREFASRPFKATKEEQIIVANRVSFLGWQTKKVFMTLEDRENNRPYFRPAAHTPRWGRDCVNWKTRKPHKERYTEAGMTIDRASQK